MILGSGQNKKGLDYTSSVFNDTAVDKSKPDTNVRQLISIVK